MNSKIINAKDATNIKSRKILVDTNIWILIEGLNGHSFKYKQDLYTATKKTLIENGNIIVVNEYILAEFCNRSAKMNYEFAKEASELGAGFMKYKDYRKTEDFRDALQAAGDTCLNILDECEFCSCHDRHFNIRDAISEFVDGNLDLSDIIIRSHCTSENYMLMSDDRDYAACPIEIITANSRLLELAKAHSRGR